MLRHSRHSYAYSSLLLLLCACAFRSTFAAVIAEKDPILAAQSSAISPVEDTGDLQDLLTQSAEESAQQPAIEIDIPTRKETAEEIHVHKVTTTQSVVHRVEAIFDYVGLSQHAGLILTACNILAYVHLLFLTSRSRRYLMEAIQIIAYLCFPTLPLIQLLNNALKTLRDALFNPPAAPYYRICSLGGQYVFHSSAQIRTFDPRRRLVEVPTNELESTTKPRLTLLWLAGLVINLVYLFAGAASVHIYRDHPTRSDWDIAAIAHDTRTGWLALSGVIASCLALLVHMCNTRWTIREEYAPEEPVSLLWESEVFTEIVLAALLQDVTAAFAGSLSLLGMMSVFMANRLVLVVLFIAVVVFNRGLRIFASGLVGPKKRYMSVRPLAVVFSVATCSSIILFQLLTAVGELWTLGPDRHEFGEFEGAFGGGPGAGER